MNYILFDDQRRGNLLPFTYTRPACEIRFGILTIREKWERYLGEEVSFLSERYLENKYSLRSGADNILINGRMSPSQELLEEVRKIEMGQRLMCDNVLLVARTSSDFFSVKRNNPAEYLNQCDEFGNPVPTRTPITMIDNLWSIFKENGKAIREDFNLLTKGRVSAKPDASVQVMGDEVFIEEGAKVSCAILNTSTGPIYIGKGAEVMEGAIIRGPFALCEGGVVKMGAKIYGPTTVGKGSKVGGELNNVIFMDNSNKAHDGFLGNSVIGDWCNLGADSNCSNLKNNYAEVKLWDYSLEDFHNTGQQFCGLFMGDHSKCGINTMFNTGTVVGVSANIFGAGFPPTHIPSFSYGGPGGFETYRFEKACEVAKKVMERRNIELTDADVRILKSVFDESERFRN